MVFATSRGHVDRAKDSQSQCLGKVGGLAHSCIHTHLDIIYIIYTQNYLVVCEPFRIRLELLKRTGPGTGALRQTLRHHRRWQINHCAWPVATTRLEGSLWCNTMIFVICGCVWNGMYPKLRISFFGENDDQPLDILGHPFSEKPSWVQGHAGLWWLSLLPLAAGLLKAEKHVTEVFWLMQMFTKYACGDRNESRQHRTHQNSTVLFTVLFTILSTIVKSSTAWRTSAIAHKQRRPTNEWFADVCSYLALRTVEICMTQEPLTHGTCKKIFGHGHEHRFDTHRPGWWFLVLNSLWSYIEYIPTEYIDSTQTNSLGVFGTCWNHQQASVTSHQAPADWEATEFHRTNMAKETIWVCWNWGDIQNCIFMQKIDDQAWSTMNYSWAPFVTQTHLNTSKIN